MAPSIADLDRGPLWSVDPSARNDMAVPPAGPLPVRWKIEDGIVMQDDLRGGVNEVTGALIGSAVPASDEPEPDAVGSGWVVPPGGSRVDAIFVLSGTLLGIGRVDRPASPVWLNLDDLVNLDAVGDPVDGLTAVEILMDDQRVIGAGWPDDFIDAVVDVLRSTAGRSSATPGSPAAAAAAPETTTEGHLPPSAHGSVPDAQAVPDQQVVSGQQAVQQAVSSQHAVSGSGSAPVAVPVDQVAGASSPAAALDLEDVVYLGGYPGQPRRRKRCTVSMSHSALELRGPSDLHVRIGWEAVRSIEVQNSDEARFRMNTKVHRDASALVVECESDVTLLLEARDCPTLPLRAAISQLLDDVPVVVV